MSNFLNYQIRPSKHVERKIFIETLQHLRGAGYNIPSYHYIGFGSFYFIDFVSFHKFLSIRKMTSLENNSRIYKRVRFNKPYKFIDLELDDFANYVSTLRNNKQYFVWLDYEGQLNEEILTSVGSLVNTLKNGSILIITVNSELRLARDTTLNGEDFAVENRGKQIDEIKGRLEEKLSPFCGTIEKSMITSAELPKLFARTLQSKIKETLKGRPDDMFFQLFNYVYKDGSQMLSIGGIIDHKDKQKEIKIALKDLDFINTKDNPQNISIPPLTTREKLYLDQKIQINKKISGNISFELEKDELDSYVRFAKHYPSFLEVFMG